MFASSYGRQGPQGGPMPLQCAPCTVGQEWERRLQPQPLQRAVGHLPLPKRIFHCTRASASSNEPHRTASVALFFLPVAGDATLPPPRCPITTRRWVGTTRRACLKARAITLLCTPMGLRGMSVFRLGYTRACLGKRVVCFLVEAVHQQRISCRSLSQAQKRFMSRLMTIPGSSVRRGAPATPPLHG